MQKKDKLNSNALQEKEDTYISHGNFMIIHRSNSYLCQIYELYSCFILIHSCLLCNKSSNRNVSLQFLLCEKIE